MLVNVVIDVGVWYKRFGYFFFIRLDFILEFLGIIRYKNKGFYYCYIFFLVKNKKLLYFFFNNICNEFNCYISIFGVYF